MKIKITHLSLLLFLFYAGSVPAQQNNVSDSVLNASALQSYGRYFFDKDQNLELISSAVHFGFSFEGKECTIYAFINDLSGHNYLQYVLDSVYQKKIKITGDTLQAITLTADNSGPHTLWIYKATEASTGNIIIQKITGNNLQPIQPSDVPLIEFIGNSITCGAESDTSEFKCNAGEYHDHHNAYYAYGPRVARALNTNFILSSVSGIGIYRTWNTDGPSMPQVYEKEDFNINDTMLWNFKTYSPKIVSIALGTNDMSHGDGVHQRLPFDSAVFVKNYIAFVQLVKSKYPKAIIALLSSPMINGDDRILLQNCIAAVKENIDALYSSDKPVALFFFLPMHGGGCGGHPSIADHAVLADELIPFFKNLLQ